MLKSIAAIFGTFLLLVGVLGFIPAFTQDVPASDHRLLLGIFEVDAIHNIVHLLTGAVALIASVNVLFARRFFQAFGIVYAAVFILGLLQGDTVLGLFPVNGADHLLHLTIALISLYMGFVYREETERVAEV